MTIAMCDTFLISPEGKVVKMWEVKDIANHSADISRLSKPSEEGKTGTGRSLPAALRADNQRDDNAISIDAKKPGPRERCLALLLAL